MQCLKWWLQNDMNKGAIIWFWIELIVYEWKHYYLSLKSLGTSIICLTHTYMYIFFKSTAQGTVDYFFNVGNK